MPTQQTEKFGDERGREEEEEEEEEEEAREWWKQAGRSRGREVGRLGGPPTDRTTDAENHKATMLNVLMFIRERTCTQR